MPLRQGRNILRIKNCIYQRRHPTTTKIIIKLTHVRLDNISEKYITQAGELQRANQGKAL